MTGRADTTAIPFALLALLAGYLFIDGLFVYLSPLQLGIYALFTLLSAAAGLLALASSRLSQGQVLVLVLWLVLVSAWLLPPLVADYPYPRYVLTDFVVLLLPAMLLAVGLRYEALFLSQRSLVVLGSLLLVAALLAVPMSESSGRHEPPHALLAAMTWAVLLLAHRPAIRWGAAGVLALLLLLSWSSGERTAVLLLLALGIAGRVMLMQRLRHALLVVAAVIALLVVVAIAFRDVIVLAAASTRLESLAQGELDTSLLNRLLEVQDVWAQWSMQAWFGFGHGATFAPDLSYPPRNMTEHGRVHHIHFGPAMLLFRYGIVGVALYLWAIVDVLRYVVLMNRVRFRAPGATIGFFFALALTGYLASFLAFNIIPDPAFSYALAGYLYIRLTHPPPRLGVVVFGRQEPIASHA